MKTKTTVVTLVSILFLAAFSWAFFQPTFFRMHDFTHVARLVEMKRALDAGHFPPHWAQNFGYGYGMPLFLFYGPLPSLIGAIFNLIGATPVWSVKLVFVLTGLLTFSGMYAFLRRWGRTAALIGAALALAAPYRAVDIFVRGALNEAFAIGLLPWILHGLWLIPEKPRHGYILTTLSTALLIFTHNLTALMALPVFYILGVLHFISLKKKLRENILFQFAAGITGIFLSFFYALPSFIEKNQTVIGDILSGYFDYHLHFLYIRQLVLPHWGYGGSEYGPNDGISFHLGFPLLATVLIGLFLLAQRLYRQWHKKHTLKLTGIDFTIISFAVAGIAALFLTLTHSQPLWDVIPLLPFIQFPWRFLSLALVLLSVAAAIGVTQVQKAPHRWIIGLALLMAVLIGQLKFHQPEKYLETDDGYYYTDDKRIRSQMSDILPDYLPKTFDRKLTPIVPEERIDIFPQRESRWEFNRPHELLYFAPTVGGGTVTWNIADFPGWEYYVNDKLVQPELLPDGRRQLITTENIDTVGARFVMTPLRTWTFFISLLSWVGFTAFILADKKTDRT